MRVLFRGVVLRQGGDPLSLTFNPGQREAVDSRAPRIVVSAGAGSGKTRVLVQRFTDRVFEQERAGVSSPIRSVLLITFTDKAAGELTERVRRTFLDAGRPDLARDVDQAWISTIHGFCARMVRRHALELGVDPGFSVLADPQTGLTRTAAFERAAKAGIESPKYGGVIRELVEGGVEELRRSVLGGYDRARSKGVPIPEIGIARCRGYREALTALREELDAVLPGYRGLRETATVTDNLAKFTALREEVVGIDVETDQLLGARATFSLGSFKGACRGDEETKGLTLRINEAIAVARVAAMDALAEERAHAWRWLLVAFADEYERAKASERALDFEDLQLLTRTLWSDRPDIAERVGAQFIEVMVDEFQDTNPLQLQVIGPISRAAQCVVGDAQQSIYRFRDADVTLLEDKRRRAEEAEADQACRLTVNYRSDARLLEGLNRMFGSPMFFGDDYLTLESGSEEAAVAEWPEEEPRIEALIVDKERCPDKDWRAVEAQLLARRLAEFVEDGRARPDEIVVLCRASTTMPVYVSALRDEGFDVVAASSGGFYGTPEYADVRALMRVLANPLDDEGVLALLAGGFGGVSDSGLLALAVAGRGRGMWQAGAGATDAALSEEDRARIGLVVSSVERLRSERGRMRLADAILHAAAELGAGGGLLGRSDSWANVRKAVRIAAEFEGSEESDPGAFLRYLDERQAFVPREPAAGAAVEGAGAVRVMTVHAAKGLEFPVVAVADLGHGLVNRPPAFLLASHREGLVVAARGELAIKDVAAGATPWLEAAQAEARLDLAESKRVFYVACTRAERSLVLAGSTEPDRGPHEGIAADWVLEAASLGGGGFAGLMRVSILGAENAEDAAPLPRAAHVVTPEGTSGQLAPRRPEPRRIPAPREISYTALALYERCAYRFFAERMLRVGSLALPNSEDPLAFGSALHAALELIARGRDVDADRLRDIAASRQLADDAVERLSRTLASVRASEAGELLVAGIPEVPFAISVGGGVIRGTMDLVVRAGDTATVLDYKTGLTWDDSGERYEAQAEVYALALLEAGVASVRVRFVHVEAGCEEVAFHFGPGDRARVLARITAAFSEMGSGRFPPLGAYDPSLCADCPVSGSLCRVVHPHKGAPRA